MFMVGVAMPYSLASRQAKGQSFPKMLLHALWRSLVLIWLGIFLRSVGRQQPYFTFEDVLTQIGLGYTCLFLLAWTKPRAQIIAAFGILVLYWLAFAFYPARDRSSPIRTSACLPIGRTCKGSPRTGTKTAISRPRSTNGSSICFRGPSRSSSMAAAI